ncbi:hypothetical protein ILUMI_05714 [Ignelater luminosus]|uniref:Mos1 transposase HTH domain-containing protein n=1 Tax=Ignelater luminosus TaxID=2038154 RepID=A0A8K0GG35_IGNLU|nr:hypothetical protein ILUMI_05714 [Ignelater luminosus]
MKGSVNMTRIKDENQKEKMTGFKGHLTFGDEAPSRDTVFRWFREFTRECNSLHNRKHTGRSCSAVTPKNVACVRKMITDDNRCTYQAIEAYLQQ